MGDHIPYTSQHSYTSQENERQYARRPHRIAQHINTHHPIARPSQPQAPELPPLLRPLLKEIEPLPPYSAVLGMCEDDLPMLFDLANPSAGPVLLIGDSGFANTLHLKMILTSMGLLNTKKELNFHLVSPHQEMVGSLITFPNFHMLFEPTMPESLTLIEEIAKLIEKRHHSGTLTPIQIFAIDGLDLLFNRLDEHLRQLLHWIVDVGPALGVWVFATIETERMTAELAPLFKMLSTHIYGKIGNSTMAYKMIGNQQVSLKKLIPGIQAALFSGKSLERIWMPRLEEDEDFLIDISAQTEAQQLALPLFNADVEEATLEDID